MSIKTDFQTKISGTIRCEKVLRIPQVFSREEIFLEFLKFFRQNNCELPRSDK